MNNSAIITLPLSPTKKNEYTRLITPVVAETLGKSLSSNFYLCANLLDSFKSRETDFIEYQNIINQNGVSYYELWKDIDHVEELLSNIYKLIDLGYIYEIDSEIYRCDCGVIEIEAKNLQTCNIDKTHYILNGGAVLCSKCQGICKLYREKILIFDSSRQRNEKFSFLPGYLNNDIKTFNNTILSSYVVISRKRSTGIELSYNGNKYNIDIDFLWATYLSLFPEKEKIILSGNKQLYNLLLVGIIDRCLNPQSDPIFIGTPIINNINRHNYSIETEDDIITKKLAIIFSIKWNMKEKQFDEQLLSYFKKMSFEKKVQLYNIICHNHQQPDEQSFESIVAKTMKNNFNMQKMLTILKKERRNV